MEAEDATTVALEQRAAACVLGLCLDQAVSGAAAQVSAANGHASPWLLCYAALEQRLHHGNAARALQHAQAAHAAFVRGGDVDGQVRALAEMGLARYQLGQRTTALSELRAAPTAAQPACTAAWALAICINALGIDDLPQALAAGEHGVAALDHEPHRQRRAVWRVTLGRNILAAYHFNGQLPAARAAAHHVLDLLGAYPFDPLTRARTWYETGLLEQRAGELNLATERL